MLDENFRQIKFFPVLSLILSDTGLEKLWLLLNFGHKKFRTFSIWDKTSGEIWIYENQSIDVL